MLWEAKLGIQRHRKWTSSGPNRCFVAGIGGASLALLILTGVVSGCSDGTSTDGSERGATDVDTTAGPAEQSTERPAETPQAPTLTPTPSLAANQVQIGNLLLTVNNVRTFNPSFGAEPGVVYYAVDVTGKNTSDRNYALNAINFQLKDSDSFVTTIGFAPGAPEPMLTHTEIAPGQEVRGWLTFKVGAGRAATELLYRSFTGTSGSIAVSDARSFTGSPAPTSTPVGLSPEETVALFYTLIDRRQFSAAYALYSSRFRASEGSFEAWQAGYATTDRVTVEFVRRVPGPGTAVEVSILARDIVNGQPLIRRFAGTWTLVQEQGGWRLDAARIQVLPAP
jgi:hypothetical protein